MPRIHNDLQDCVIYLYPSEDHAAQGEKVGGSGFLVQIPLPSDENRGVVFAVTNKHVVKHAPVVRLNRVDGSIAIAPFEKKRWIEHPDGDDLAIVPMGGLDTQFHRFKTVPRSMFLLKPEMEKQDIGLGDDIFLLGRFVNHEGKVQNTPSLRFGNIAQMPALIRQDTGFDQESFLVEAKSISGYSGSPVFVQMLPMSSRPKKDDPRTLMIVPLPGSGPWLLGVDWGHLHNWEEVCDETCHSVLPKRIVSSNTGMMGVVPAWKLNEMFELNEVQEVIRKVDEELKIARAQSVGRTDYEPAK